MQSKEQIQFFHNPPHPHPLHAFNTSQINLVPIEHVQPAEEPSPSFTLWGVPRIFSVGYIGFLINYLINNQGGFIQVSHQ